MSKKFFHKRENNPIDTRDFEDFENDPMGNYTGTSIYGDPEQDVDDL